MPGETHVAVGQKPGTTMNTQKTKKYEGNHAKKR